MPNSPFPGMDPYLEAPDIWPSLHSRLTTMFADLLTPQIVPKYIADLNTQIVIEYNEDDTNGEPGGTELTVVPDVAVHVSGSVTTSPVVVEDRVAAPLHLHLPMPFERRLTTVRIVRRTDQKLVTVIELLSPVNKRPGQQRRDYLEKRARYIESSVHLVEIDFFRKWPRMPLEERAPACDYLVLVSDAHQRPDVLAWPISLRQELPTIPIPLLRSDPPAMLALGEALQTVYQRARYDLRIDYTRPPPPRLSPADAEWAAGLLAKHVR